MVGVRGGERAARLPAIPAHGAAAVVVRCTAPAHQRTLLDQPNGHLHLIAALVPSLVATLAPALDPARVAARRRVALGDRCS